MPEVSIIVPVFNREKYLKRCLESILSQTLSDIEIICINDCSKDNSLAILKQYAESDSRIKIIDFKENKGVSFARNEGIKASGGKYIAFVDSDDFIDPDFYKKLYTEAKKSGSDIVKGNIYNYNDDTNKSCLSDFYNMNSKIRKNSAYFYYGFTSAIYKTKFIKDNNIFFPEGINYFEDPYFSIKCINHTDNISIVEDAIYYYTENPDSLSKKHTSKKAYEDMKTAIFTTAGFLNNSSISKEKYLIIFKFLSGFILNHCCSSPLKEMQEEAPEDILKLIDNIKFKDVKEEIFKSALKRLNGSNKSLLLKFLRYKIRKKGEKPLISVIIPVYNTEEYLERCLDSVVSQTLKNIEIICINDHSKDNSLEILEKYALYDKRIKIINCKENTGESKARNLGLNVAKGEFLAFVDNDDKIDINFYEKLYKKAKDTGADIVKGNTVTIDYKGTSTASILNPEIKESKNKWHFAYEWWSAIYKADIIKENNLKLPEECILGGDVLFLNEALYYANKLEIVDDASYYWIRRKNSGESAILSKEKIISALKVYEKIQSNINRWYKNNEINTFSYNLITKNCFWLPLEYIFRNDEASCKEICAGYLIKYYKNCAEKNFACNYLKATAPYLYIPILNNDKKELYNKILNIKSREDFNNKNIFAKLRNNMVIKNV